MSWLFVALGGAVGAGLRHVLARRFDGRFPTGILLVNVVGSLALGLLVGAVAPEDLRLLLGTGLCGALTTYSAFGFQTVVLVESRERLLGTLYVLASLVGGLVAALTGLAVGGVIGGG